MQADPRAILAEGTLQEFSAAFRAWTNPFKTEGEASRHFACRRLESIVEVRPKMNTRRLKKKKNEAAVSNPTLADNSERSFYFRVETAAI